MNMSTSQKPTESGDIKTLKECSIFDSEEEPVEIDEIAVLEGVNNIIPPSHIRAQISLSKKKMNAQNPDVTVRDSQTLNNLKDEKKK